MSREQFVEPSTGSRTTVIAASSGPLRPDSSLTTPTPASCRIGRIAASATRSRAYWPGRSVRARRAAPVSGASDALAASAASPKTASKSSGVTGGTLLLAFNAVVGEVLRGVEVRECVRGRDGAPFALGDLDHRDGGKQRVERALAARDQLSGGV